MTHCFNSIREEQTSPNTGVREVLSKEAVIWKGQSLLIRPRTQPGPQTSWALVYGTKASPTHLAFHHLKLFVLKESLVGPGNEAKMSS